MNTRLDAPLAHGDIHVAGDVAGLLRIFDTDTQLCYLPRDAHASISSYLRDAAPHLGAGLRLLVDAGSGFDAERLPDLPDRQPLVADIDFLLDLYFDLLDCPRIALRLEVIQRAMCPRFHVDRTGIRLLCTWRGPGTQWLREDCADRRRLGHGAGGLDDACSGLILDADGIGEVPPCAIVLLKGELWQGNTGRGTIHRSPDVPAGEAPRVMLALDAVWE